MSSDPDPQHIARDATWLVQAIDGERRLARLLRMDPYAYRQASFLDDRMLTPGTIAKVLPLDVIVRASALTQREDARWIFHIGHVGSTLLSRLLGELPGVLAVREPRVLRDVALIPPEQRADLIDPLRRLLSRTFAPNEVAVIKATSFVSEIAAQLIGSRGQAVFLFASPRAYIAGILAGENSVKELNALAGWRRQRGGRRFTVPPDADYSDAHRAAVAWACEMTALEEAAETSPGGAVRWADFDVMLDDMAQALGEVARFFAIEAAAAELDRIATGPLMTRYSKALEYEYSADLRRELIAEAEDLHAADIDGALAMLRSASETSPLLKRALLRGGV